MPLCTVHDPALIARLTGFLVIVPMALMHDAPTSVRVRIGATRINELIASLSRLALSGRVDLNPSPRVWRACQVAIFALVMQASNHVRFGKINTWVCSDRARFRQHAVYACRCLVILLVSLSPGLLCLRSRSPSFFRPSVLPSLNLDGSALTQMEFSVGLVHFQSMTRDTDVRVFTAACIPSNT